MGALYGIGSVVNTFNRYPTLMTACLRRFLGILAAAYFDDVAVIDSASSMGTGQQCARGCTQ